MSRLGFIPPQLPSLTDQPPEGANWFHEVKHDGYRTMLVIERSTARAYTRNGHDWSDRYPGIIASARKLPCRSACAAHELEGIVSKLASSRYRSGRSKTWLKTKCFTEGEFLLLGIDRDRTTNAPRALLAKSEGGQFVYAGPRFHRASFSSTRGVPR